MNRRYYRKDRLVEVEEVDGVVAVHSVEPSADGARGHRASERAGADVRAAARQIDDDTLDAFARAGWQLLTDAERDERGARAATPAASVVINEDGRPVIATDVLAVQLDASLSADDARRVLDEAGLSVLTELRFAPNLFEVRTSTGDALDASVRLHDDARFVFAEPSFVEHVPQRFTPTDPEYGDQWQWSNTGQGGGTAGADVSAEAAWDHTFGAGIRVAVIDNGFDADHEDLAAGVGAGSGFFTGSPATLTVGTAGMPDGDHGTFCAGMVGARRGGGTGGVGAAPDAELMLVACLGDQVGTQTTLARAVAYSADPSTEVPAADPATGADIIVSSLGPNGADWALTTTLELAIEAAAANGRGGLGTAIFWAASNGADVDVSLDQVVSHPDVIAVVRSTRDDLEDDAARGDEVELIAPGVDVVNAFSGNTYGPWTGTSFAAPAAAGCAALALSVNPDLTRDELRQIMRDTADQVGGVVYDAAGHNDDYGFGRVNAFAAVRAAARRVELLTPTVVFNDVPEDETTARAVVWEVAGIEDLTFEVVSGPTTTTGAASSFTLLLGSSVTLPAPGVGAVGHARLWLIHTGTDAGDTATGEIVVRCVETGEEWTVAITANTIERPTAAVVMVMDRSGSMDFDAGDGRKRVEVLRESAHVLVDLLQPETGIGVVRFDHDAAPVMAVADAGPEVFGAGRAQAAAAVASHAPNPAGATSIGDGVASAGTLLAAVGASYDTTAMIVLTDGQENAPASIADVAGSIGDTVFAIGLGEPSAVDPAALTALTDGTGGYVTMTGNLSSDEHFLLAKYYLQILAGVTNEQVVLDPEGFVEPGDTVKVPFDLTRGDSSTDVILLVPEPGAVRFSLVTPSGDVVTAGSPGVRYVTGATVGYYRLSLPYVDAGGGEHWDGTWHAVLQVDRGGFAKWLQHLEETDVEAYHEAVRRGVRYLLEVHSRSSLTLRATLRQDGIAPGSVMHLTAHLDEFSIPVDGGRARVRALVTGPAGHDQVDLTATEDGVFEGDFTATDHGVHRFRLVAEGTTLRGEHFTREQLLSGSVYVPRPNEEDPEPPKDGEVCKDELDAFLATLRREPRLAKQLDAGMTQHGSSLTALLHCLGRTLARPHPPVVVRPPFVRPPLGGPRPVPTPLVPVGGGGVRLAGGTAPAPAPQARPADGDLP
ncbi:S8 family serine peptidase [Cellulomonas carbonis]|uniref:S8 family serine peptidase n=2 Tax=Cellulomonas carbonis TaxID=1386092 RepID=UPI001667E555|nr:S8 family serine peptidase [Cellulomonas carbonis]GGC08879.1 hypothetical protein GCM10010972_22710 [Cellulomonas carbonis]